MGQNINKNMSESGNCIKNRVAKESMFGFGNGSMGLSMSMNENESESGGKGMSGSCDKNWNVEGGAELNENKVVGLGSGSVGLDDKGSVRFGLNRNNEGEKVSENERKGKGGNWSYSFCYGLRIGILAGSFNPPHKGHLMLAEEAIKRCRLDFVYLLVSPQNPFKKNEGKNTLPLERRVHLCEELVKGNSRIKVSDIEKFSPTYESYFTYGVLKRRFVGANIVWIIGSDILRHIHRWKRHGDIIRGCEVVCFSRAYANGNLSQCFGDLRSPVCYNYNGVKKNGVKYISYIHNRSKNISSTLVREKEFGNVWSEMCKR